MDQSEVKHFPKVDHTPAELDGVAKLLLKGAALIEERGHNKGGYEKEGRLCFRGSLNMAATGNSVWGTPLCDEASVKFLRVIEPGPGGWLKWNDVPERTADEVISAMRRVAFEHV